MLIAIQMKHVRKVGMTGFKMGLSMFRRTSIKWFGPGLNIEQEEYPGQSRRGYSRCESPSVTVVLPGLGHAGACVHDSEKLGWNEQKVENLLASRYIKMSRLLCHE